MKLALAVAARKFPTRFAYRKNYDEKLAHLIEAGMDISLIPSRFEPAGLSAMYNLKYGALPVARATGGIQEIIEDYDPTADSGYGFLCYEYSSEAFWDAIKRARQIFRDRAPLDKADETRDGTQFFVGHVRAALRSSVSRTRRRNRRSRRVAGSRNSERQRRDML